MSLSEVKDKKWWWTTHTQTNSYHFLIAIDAVTSGPAFEFVVVLLQK